MLAMLSLSQSYQHALRGKEYECRSVKAYNHIDDYMSLQVGRTELCSQTELSSVYTA